MDKEKVARGTAQQARLEQAQSGSAAANDDDVIVIMKIPKQAIKGINETKRNGMNE